MVGNELRVGWLDPRIAAYAARWQSKSTRPLTQAERRLFAAAGHAGERTYRRPSRSVVQPLEGDKALEQEALGVVAKAMTALLQRRVSRK